MEAIAVIFDKRVEYYKAIWDSNLPLEAKEHILTLWGQCCEAARNGEKRKFIAIDEEGNEIKV